MKPSLLIRDGADRPAGCPRRRDTAVHGGSGGFADRRFGASLNELEVTGC